MVVLTEAQFLPTTMLPYIGVPPLWDQFLSLSLSLSAVTSREPRLSKATKTAPTDIQGHQQHTLWDLWPFYMFSVRHQRLQEKEAKSNMGSWGKGRVWGPLPLKVDLVCPQNLIPGCPQFCDVHPRLINPASPRSDPDVPLK